MIFKEIQSDYTDVKIPEALRWAVMKRGEAEVLIYQLITACLVRFEDVEIRLDKNDSITKFLKSFQREGLFDGNALGYEEGENVDVLSCKFDLYGLHEDFETMNDKIFGTISMNVIDACLDSDNFEIPSLQQREASIQKVKSVGEVRP